MNNYEIERKISHIENQLYRFASDEDLRRLRGTVEQQNHEIQSCRREINDQRELIDRLRERVEALETTPNQP